MNPLSQITGRAVDRALGFAAPAVPHVLRRDVRVPMPDGVVLLGDHYRPAGPDRPLPVVLIRSPYGRGGASVLFAAPLARRGFQVFVQSTRGPFGAIPNPRQLARMRRALRKVPLQAADVAVAGAPVAFWRDFTGHADPGDGFWAGADHDQADLGRLPPVSMVTGWWDLFLPG